MNRTRNYFAGSVLAAVAVGSSMALFASSAGAAQAAATVNASTQIQGAPDTTVGSTITGYYEAADFTITTDSTLSVYGPVWATDTYTDKFQIKALGNNTYSVQRQANGTFTAFAEPNTDSTTPVLINVTGQLHGTISYTVTSTQGPSGTPTSPEPAGTGTSAILHQIFGPSATIGGGNDWVFAYNTATSRMVQAWNTDPSTWGNITG
jgi:hypothetical protein